MLLSTNDKPIVEDSHRDRFWGAVLQENGTLVGENVLGRLLMELRESLKNNKSIDIWKAIPPMINNFNLLGNPIPTINASNKEEKKSSKKEKLIQLDLFQDS